MDADPPAPGTIEVIARPARTWALFFFIPMVFPPRVHVDGNPVGWAIWFRPLVCDVPVGMREVTVSYAGYVRSLEVRVHADTPTRLIYHPPATRLGTGRLVVADSVPGDPTMS